MCKIKLLISLLISLVVSSCTSINSKKDNTKFSIGYVSGGYDGLLLYNNLDIHLNSYDMLDKSSRYEIKSSIGHSTSVYVTNIDNTSNRESISSELELIIYDKKLECNAYSYNDRIYQFYVFSSNEKFISNQKALRKIKNENTEELAKKFISTLMYENIECEFKNKFKGLEMNYYFKRDRFGKKHK